MNGLNEKQKDLLFKLRDFLKENEIDIDCRDLRLWDSRSKVSLDWLMTSADYGESYELGFKVTKEPDPPNHTEWCHTMANNKIKQGKA